LTLGTADFFFIEDNSFEFDDLYRATGVPVMDMDAGAGRCSAQTSGMACGNA